MVPKKKYCVTFFSRFTHSAVHTPIRAYKWSTHSWSAVTVVSL